MVSNIEVVRNTGRLKPIHSDSAAAAIHRYLAEHNHNPKAFVWTKPTDQILAKLNRLNASAR